MRMLTLILIGGGSDRTQSIVSNDLLKQRNDTGKLCGK